MYISISNTLFPAENRAYKKLLKRVKTYGVIKGAKDSILFKNSSLS